MCFHRSVLSAEAAQYGRVGSPTEASFSILLNDKNDTDLSIERN